MAKTKQTEMAAPPSVGRQPINLDRLFRPYTSTEVGGQKIYLRVLSDAELAIRDMAASHASRKLARALGDPTTPEYDRYIAPLQEGTRRDLIETLVAVRQSFIGVEVAQEIRPNYIAASGDPDITGEEAREIDAKRDKEWEATVAARKGELEARVAAYKAELDGQTDEELLAECTRWQINGQSRMAYGKESLDNLVYLCTFRDAAFKERFFADIDEVHETSAAFKAAIERLYNEVDQSDVFQLKN